MQTTYTRHLPGNLAIGCECWTLPMPDAKKLMAWMKSESIARPGCYWTNNIIKPIRSAVRRKETSVKIRTAGFSTGQFANYLHNAGIEYNQVD